MLVGFLRCRDQALDGLLDHGLQPRIVVDAARGCEYARVLAQHRGCYVGFGLLDLRRRRGRLLLDRRRRRRACRQHQRRDSDAGVQQPITRNPQSSPSHRHVTCISFHVGRLDLFRTPRRDPRSAPGYLRLYPAAAPDPPAR